MIALLAPSVKAQLVTFNTIQDYTGQGTTSFTNGTTALGTTFSDVAEINSIEFQFVQTAGTDMVSTRPSTPTSFNGTPPRTRR